MVYCVVFALRQAGCIKIGIRGQMQFIVYHIKDSHLFALLHEF